MKPALRYVEDGLAIGRDRAWAWYRIPTRSYDLLSDEDRLAEARAFALGISALRDSECHLVVTHRPLVASDWSAALDEATTEAQPGWEAYLSQLEQKVAAESFAERMVFLAVALGERSFGLKGTGRRAKGDEPAGDAAGVTGKESDRWRTQADLVRRALSGSGLRPRPAPADDLRWLVQRSFHRGLPAPPLQPMARAWGGALRTLVEGTVHNGRRSLRIEQPAGERWLAFLAVAHLPERLVLPGQEWLYQTDLLGPHIDISVRFRMVPARRAAVAAGRKVAEAHDQARNIAGTASPVPIAVAEMAEQARELEHSLTRDGLPLVDAQATLCVAAASEAELEAAVIDCVELYRDLGIELARPTGDQLGLFLQALPGERWRVRGYEQRMPPVTLAGAMAQATVALGDTAGPYIGWTTGRSRNPVHFDPLQAALDNQPTAVAVTGAPGGGKTTLAQLLTYQMALRGTTVLSIDPKGDSRGVTTLPGLGRSRVVELGHQQAGLLDPYTVAGSPAQGALLAADACRLLLAPGLTSEQESSLLAACRAVAGWPDPCLTRVVQTLASDHSAAARSVSATLEAYADLPAASLCFAPARRSARSPRAAAAGETDVSPPPAQPATARPASPDLLTGLTVFTLEGITFPDQTTPRNEYSLSDRLAVTVLHLMTAMAARLADAAPERPKAVVLDEAWALTQSTQGRALVQRLARTGRSKNTALLLVSQNAADFLDEQVTNCVSATFAFRSTQPGEIESVLQLLGLQPTPEGAAAVRSLRNGECIMADVAGRVGTIAVDLVVPYLETAFDTTPQRRVRVSP